jgi:hypothetical protein
MLWECALLLLQGSRNAVTWAALFFPPTFETFSIARDFDFIMHVAPDHHVHFTSQATEAVATALDHHAMGAQLSKVRGGFRRTRMFV